MHSKLSRYADGVMEAVWLAAVILAPVFFNVYSSRIFEPDKITLVRSLALFGLAAWLVKLVEQGGLRWEHFRKPQSLWRSFLSTPLLPVVALMMLAYLLSTLFSVGPRTSLLGSYQRLQGTYTTFSYIILFWLLVSNLRRRAQVERLFTLVIISSLPVALYGVLQRYEIDPIPWGGDTTLRVAANMGNAIFVAAYLIMAVPLTLGRIVSSFRAILSDSGALWPNLIRATLYVFIFALQLITIYFSGSRGPLLGLLAGGYLMVLLLSLLWGKRWLTYAVIGAALAGASFLVAFNIPNGPLESLRSSPAIGRFGSLLDTDSNTAKVRLYIWQGAVELTGLHDPLQFPDGSADAWNILRPLIGYGPESMYVAYNPFYVPELGHVERRNASPDRSHNETWDSVVITGWLGFGVYMALFLSFFYYGFSWLGLVQERSQKLLFWGLAGAGGLLVTALVVGWQGLPYLGIGLPFGVALGLLVYLGQAALFGRYQAPTAPAEIGRALALVALISAVMAHWIEINFGIAIVSTRTHFWVYAALLVLVGYVLPRAGEYIGGKLTEPKAETDKPATDKAEKAPERAAEARLSKRRAKIAGKPGRAGRLAEWPWATAAAGGFTLAIILSSLGYSYITNADRSTSVLEIIANSFTTLRGGRSSLGVLALLLTTWLAGSLLWNAERSEDDKAPAFWPALGVTLATTLGLGLVYLLWQAGALAALAGLSPSSIEELLAQVATLSGLLTNLYFYIFLLILAGGWFFSHRLASETRLTSGAGLVVAPVLLILAAIFIYTTNLRVIHADITFKMAEPFSSTGQWPVASALYDKALELAPSEDYYYLFLGRAYLEQAKTLQDPNQKSLLVQQAELDLKQAQRINPLNTDHTANLARLYSWWAAQSSGQDRLTRAQTSIGYYQTALKLSPQNSTLWGELALAYLDLLGQPEQARQTLEHALTLDERYNFTLGLLGDYHLRLSRNLSGAERQQELAKSLDYYQRAVDASVSYDSGSRIGYIATLGNIYIEAARLDDANYDSAMLRQAVQTFEKALAASPNSADAYRIEEQIARVYFQMNEFEPALRYAQAALQHAPQAEQARLTQFLEALTAAVQPVPPVTP